MNIMDEFHLLEMVSYVRICRTCMSSFEKTIGG